MSEGINIVETPRKPLAELPVVIGFLTLAGLVFQQTNTSFVEQGAAAGGAMFNAALYPELLAWLIVLLALIRLVNIAKDHRTRTAEANASNSGDHKALSTAFVCMGFLVVYLIALRPLGYHLTTPVFMFACFYVLGTKRIHVAVVLSLGTSLVMSFVFEFLLKVILPVGIFGIGF